MSQEMLGSLPSKLATTILIRSLWALDQVSCCIVESSTHLQSPYVTTTQISSQKFPTDEAEEFLVQSLKVLLESKQVTVTLGSSSSRE